MGLLDDAIREHLDLKRKRGADPSEIERLEREALGPVRREPTAYSTEHLPQAQAEPEDGFDEAQDYQEEPPRQPSRRGFLWRRRRGQRHEPAPAAHPEGEPEPEWNDDPDTSDMEPEDYDAAPAGAAPDSEPPRLTFDSPPPKRPRFTVDSSEPPTGPEPAATAPTAEPPHEDHVDTEAIPGKAVDSPAHGGPTPTPSEEPPPDRPEPGATHEWDVESAFTDEDSSDEDSSDDKGSSREGSSDDKGSSGDDSDPARSEDDDDMLEGTPDFLQDTPEHDRLWFEQRPPRDFNFGD